MADAVEHDWARPAVILVATDLSDLDRLMPHAFHQAAISGARLLLLHVLSPIAAISADASGLPYYDVGGALEIADKTLQHWRQAAHARSIRCDALVREGQALHEIEIAIRQFHVDCLIVGTRSRSKLGKLLVGSVAEQVLRSVNLPVITVGPEAYLQEPGSGEPVLLLATALRETSRPGAVLACRIAAAQKARLILLHVMPPLDVGEHKSLTTGQDSIALRQLRLLAAEAGADSGANVDPVVVHGNPVIEILAEASALHAGLIILGARQRSTFEELTRNRTVYRVLAHARCPVLTLRDSLAILPSPHLEAVGAHHA
jgi:nucleotide-binding universal stress UspA family protein